MDCIELVRSATEQVIVTGMREQGVCWGMGNAIIVAQTPKKTSLLCVRLFVIVRPVQYKTAASFSKGDVPTAEVWGVKMTQPIVCRMSGFVLGAGGVQRPKL